MSTQQVTVEPVTRFDADAATTVEIPPGSSASTELSRHRTALSRHRTALSEHRTKLSEHRSELSDRRTQLAEKRTAVSILRSHLANERTHLSYLRTAIALVGFGITLNRFAIYLIQNERLTPSEAARPMLSDAKWVGIGMVVLGVVLLAWSLFRFRRTANDIERERYHTNWRAVLVMTVGVLVIGIATTVWLFTR